MQVRLHDLELPVQQRLRAFAAEHFAKRLWAKDASLWSTDPVGQKDIRNSLGWLGVAETLRGRVPEMEAFADECARAGFTDALLIGMGGSSLCPEVFRQTFAPAPGRLRLHVLDSTDPDQIAAVERSLVPAQTLVLVASKSGATIEIETLLAYFFDRIGRPDHFAAITDPGTPLHHLAREKSFRKIFLNPPDIGGRFSALSLFGLVPAALLGLDVAALLRSAMNLSVACGPTIAETDNVAVVLGTFLAEAQRRGRDKVTLVCAPGIASFGLWVEQLVAESTGKNGTGLLPIVGEPPAEILTEQPDRSFVLVGLATGKNEELKALQSRLETTRAPYVRIDLSHILELGGEFLRWELATAVAGHILGIQPFNQPDVQGSKTLTKELLEGGTKAVSVPCSGADEIRRHLAGATAGEYVALLAYLPYEARISTALARLRLQAARVAGRPVTVGFGPRYLHSTGQYHKGGPKNGLFVLLTADKAGSIAIPGKNYDFGALQEAQALGDFTALERKGRRILRFHLEGDAEKSVETLTAALG